MTDGIAMKGKQIIMPFILQNQILESSCAATKWALKKRRLPVKESGYWVSMKVDIEHTVKQCTTCLEYQQMQSQESMLPMKYHADHGRWSVLTFHY